MIRAFVAIFWIGLCLTSAIAQTGDRGTDAIIGGFYQEAEHNKTVVLDEIRSKLTNRQKAVFDRLKFNIDRNGWNFFAVYTANQEVYVSLGFLVHLNMLNGALAYETTQFMLHNTPINFDRVMKFNAYYVDTLTANSRAFRLGRAQQPLKSYYQWLGMSADQSAALNADATMQATNLRNLALLNNASLTMVLGHELGHNVLDHLAAGVTIGPKQEAEADAFAFAISVKAGHPPLAAIAAFVMMDRFERKPGSAPAASDHPPALCRWFAAMSVGWKAIKGDRELLDEMTRRGLASNVEQLSDLLDKGQAFYVQNCPVASYGLCDTIKRYLDRPPQGFVANRGAPLDAGEWDARTDLINSKCAIRQRTRGSRTIHGLSCVMNFGRERPPTETFYAKGDTEIAACLSGLGVSGQWQRDSTEDNDDFEETTGTNWSLDTGAASYEIDLQKIGRTNGSSFHNYFRIGYTTR